jgi:hypothetical protein
MPTTTIAATLFTSESADSTYPPAREGFGATPGRYLQLFGFTGVEVTQRVNWYNSGEIRYSIWTPLLRFDTRTIPSDALVTNAVLSFQVTNRYAIADSQIEIRALPYQSDYGSWPTRWVKGSEVGQHPQVGSVPIPEGDDPYTTVSYAFTVTNEIKKGGYTFFLLHNREFRLGQAPPLPSGPASYSIDTHAFVKDVVLTVDYVGGSGSGASTHVKELIVSQPHSGAAVTGSSSQRCEPVQANGALLAAGTILPDLSRTGTEVVSVETGFRPKVILLLPGGTTQNLVSGQRYYQSVPYWSEGFGITIPSGTRYAHGQFHGYTVSPNQYWHYRGLVNHSYVTHYFNRSTGEYRRLFGDVGGVNDRGFSVDVHHGVTYGLAYLAIGGNIEVDYGTTQVTATSTSWSDATVSLPWYPDCVFLTVSVLWNDEQEVISSTSYTSYRSAQHFAVVNEDGTKKLAVFYPAMMLDTTNITNGFVFTYQSAIGGPSYNYYITADTAANPDRLTVRFRKALASNPNATITTSYVAIRNMPVRAKQFHYWSSSYPSNVTFDLGWEPGANVLFGAASPFLAFDLHSRDSSLYGRRSTQAFTTGAFLGGYKRSPASGQNWYATITSSGDVNFLMLGGDVARCQQTVELSASSVSRSSLSLPRTWSKVLSAASNWVASLFYQAPGRTQEEVVLETQSGQSAEMNWGLAKLLHAVSNSVQSILDTTWGRHLRKIRLLTPTEIEVCPGDDLLLRLKVRAANRDRHLRDENDLVRMALLDWWSDVPVAWLGVGDGIELEDDGQAAIRVPWGVLAEAFGRTGACRYRVELWPDESAGGWIVHVGTIRRAR